MRARNLLPTAAATLLLVLAACRPPWGPDTGPPPDTDRPDTGTEGSPEVELLSPPDGAVLWADWQAEPSEGVDRSASFTYSISVSAPVNADFSQLDVVLESSSSSGSAADSTGPIQVEQDGSCSGMWSVPLGTTTLTAKLESGGQVLDEDSAAVQVVDCRAEANFFIWPFDDKSTEAEGPRSMGGEPALDCLDGDASASCSFTGGRFGGALSVPVASGRSYVVEGIGGEVESWSGTAFAVWFQVTSTALGEDRPVLSLASQNGYYALSFYTGGIYKHAPATTNVKIAKYEGTPFYEEGWHLLLVSFTPSGSCEVYADGGTDTIGGLNGSVLSIILTNVTDYDLYLGSDPTGEYLPGAFDELLVLEVGNDSAYSPSELSALLWAEATPYCGL